jgi:hypothetical protein
MSAEKLGPPVATSLALDRLKSTSTGGNSFMGAEKLVPAHRHQLGAGPPRVSLHRGVTAS